MVAVKVNKVHSYLPLIRSAFVGKARAVNIIDQSNFKPEFRSSG